MVWYELLRVGMGRYGLVWVGLGWYGLVWVGNDDEDGDELNVVNVVNGQEAVVMGGVVLAMGQAVVPPLPLPPVIHGDSDSGQGASTDASTDTAWSLVVGHDDSGAEI